MQKTAVIVPCHNEGKRLDANKFIKLAAENKLVNFIFVNDGSSDNTLEIIKYICEFDPNQMYCINLTRNCGKAEAVRQGFLRALEMDFFNIGYWDADLATPLEAISNLCSQLDRPGIMMVMGSRVKLLGRRIERHRLRHYVGRAFATCASLVLSLPVYDTQCGAKIFKSTKELKMVFCERFRVNWVFDVEIIARFLMIERVGGRFCLEEAAVEYPLEEWTDVPGSKLKISDFFLAAWQLLKIFLFLHAPGIKQRCVRRWAAQLSNMD
jgi:glycosyltransferase involved in cell wall biosynthesis